MNLTDKVAIVTGSGRGIGRAIALKLAEDGATVVINDISNAAEDVAAEIHTVGGKSRAVIADISSADEVNHMVETTMEAFGRIDILVNNAGIARDQLLLRMSEEEWDSVLKIDLKSVFLCTKAVARPMMKQRWGRIISISSIVGLIGNPGQVNYAAAKAGIVGFTMSVAREMASRGITANAIAPGFIDTEMTQKLSEQQQQELMANIPLGRLGSPEDVASVACFLASEDAGYITGQVLTVDGGMTMA
ncbi:3-oxoacyl-[acyl-carrier-protein] reductase [Chloroflexota bacterium]